MVERPDPTVVERDPLAQLDALAAIAVGLLLAIVLLAALT